MTRLITVSFAIPDDDPAHDQGQLVHEIQGLLYDGEGMAGSFRVISNTEFIGNPHTYGFEDPPERPWFALADDGQIYALGDHGDFDAAEETAASIAINAIWIADRETAEQWLSRLLSNL